MAPYELGSPQQRAQGVVVALVEVDLPPVELRDVDLLAVGGVAEATAGPPPEAGGRAPDVAAVRSSVRRTSRWLVVLLIGVVLASVAAMVAILFQPQGPSAPGVGPSEDSDVVWLTSVLILTGAVGILILLLARRTQSREPGRDRLHVTRDISAAEITSPTPPVEMPVILTDRVRVGVRGRAVTTDALADNEAVRDWIEQAPDSAYSLVRLVCSFRPAEGERITRGWVIARLSGPPQAVRPPVVWSLLPKEVWSSSATTRTVRMGADLKLIEASREVAHAGSHALLVRGMGELQSQAEWHISPGDESLHGDNQFLMVVERPSNSPATCEVEVGITLTRRMRGMTFLAQLPDEARRLVLA